MWSFWMSTTKKKKKANEEQDDDDIFCPDKIYKFMAIYTYGDVIGGDGGKIYSFIHLDTWKKGRKKPKIFLKKNHKIPNKSYQKHIC